MFCRKPHSIFDSLFLEVKSPNESDPVSADVSGDDGSWVTDFANVTVDSESDFDEVSSDDTTVTSESSVTVLPQSAVVMMPQSSECRVTPDMALSQQLSSMMALRLSRETARQERAVHPRVNRGGLYREVSAPTQVGFWSYNSRLGFIFFSASGAAVCAFISARACAALIARWTVFSRSRSYGLLQPSA